MQSIKTGFVIFQAQQSSSDNEFFLSDLFCTSVPSEDQDELNSYISSNDSGADVLGYWRGKEDNSPS